MFDMLITLWYKFKYNPMIKQDLSKGGTTFCGLGWSILSEN